MCTRLGLTRLDLRVYGKYVANYMMHISEAIVRQNRLPVRLNKPMGGYSGKPVSGTFWSGASVGRGQDSPPTAWLPFHTNSGLPCRCSIAALMHDCVGVTPVSRSSPACDVNRRSAFKRCRRRKR